MTNDWKPDIGKAAMWRGWRVTVLGLNDTVAWVRARNGCYATFDIAALSPAPLTREEVLTKILSDAVALDTFGKAYKENNGYDPERQVCSVIPDILEAIDDGRLTK